MEQAKHFLEETDLVHDLVSKINEADFERETLFKKWTINDILVHLHFWNMGADLSLNRPDEYDKMMKQFFDAIQTGNLRQHENAVVHERGKALLEMWYELSKQVSDDFSTVDPKQRLKWAGPTMSALTCISARQMEVWAHGQAIFDLLGKEREEDDRIKNIVILGINSFAWTHQVHKLEMPDAMPFVKLMSPSGKQWSFGEENDSQYIEGAASDFAKVVTQTRNIADTDLSVTGEAAKNWMRHAQCFAGPAEMPPAPGLRKRNLNEAGNL